MLKSQNYNGHYRKFTDPKTGKKYLAQFVADPELADQGMCILIVEGFLSGEPQHYIVDAMPPGHGAASGQQSRRYKFMNEWAWLMEEKVQEYISLTQ